MTTPRPGMDHMLYEFSAIDRRPALSWPDGAPLAVSIVLHLEYWELMQPPDAWRDPRFQGAFPTFTPDYTAFTQREYGNRVGIFRVLELLDRLNLNLTVPVNSAALDRYPALIARLSERNVEWVAHGRHANRMVTSKMDTDTQRQLITQSVDKIEAATGSRPTGWAGPGYGEAWDTAQIVAECGLDYLMDWPNDDQPYMLHTAPPLVSIPRQPEWDDVEALWLRHLPMQIWPELIDSAFTTLLREGRKDPQQSARYFTLSLHPWLIGQAHRIRYLEEALTSISAHSDQTWQATAGDIARHVRGQLRK